MINSDVNTAGAEIAYTWLKNHGYFKISVTHVANHDYIEADGKSRRILVKLKVSEYPESPQPMTDDEIAELLLNASTIEREPWVAKIQVGEHGSLSGEINWQNLAKKQ